ncbi:hypothetical protein QBC43DRAFT_90095 [Cladorrhinum sp. PSN259]|nr:hypothetical protein QBC43DRAFT_90095 [Cladorrhinum sp. PSN259]
MKLEKMRHGETGYHTLFLWSFPYSHPPSTTSWILPYLISSLFFLNDSFLEIKVESDYFCSSYSWLFSLSFVVSLVIGGVACVRENGNRRTIALISSFQTTSFAPTDTPCVFCLLSVFEQK